MSKKYKIIRRIQDHKYDICDFVNRQYDKPLAGCGNYIEDINVGDIIGVKFQDCIKRYIEFDPEAFCLSDYPKSIYKKRIGSYVHVEEHLYKIVKINKTKTKFNIEPVFIDKNKIIVKDVSESFVVYDSFDLNDLRKYTAMQIIYSELNCDFNVSSKNEIYDFEINKVIDMFKQNKVDFKKIFLYDDFKLCIFNIYDDSYEKCLIEYLDLINNFIKTNIDINIDLHKYNLGSIEEIKIHMDELYQNILFIKNVNLPVTYSYDTYSHIDVPQIEPNQQIIKYIDIFRVYKTDSLTKLVKTKYVTNWSYIVLEEKTRNYVSVGNCLRICLKYSNIDYRLYMTLLYKVSETTFLACIQNMNGSNFEDIVLVIDISNISEIPTIFEMNNSIPEYKKYVIENQNKVIQLGIHLPLDNNIETMDMNYHDFINKIL
jgi:hypothetical protein